MTVHYPSGLALRPLGDVEHVFHNLAQVAPATFSFALHLDRLVDVEVLGRAVRAVQASHPLLAACVTGTCRPWWVATSAPVPVVRTDHHDWREVFVGEQTKPFDAERDPLWRLILVDSSPRDTDGLHGSAVCSVVVSFTHQLIDGVGAVWVLGELVRALNGVRLSTRRIPEAQETLLHAATGRTAAKVTPPSRDVAVADPRLTTPAEFVPLDDRRPMVTTATLGSSATAALLNSARQNDATVHGALAAAAHLAVRRSGREFVRIVHPADLRRVASLPTDEAAMRLVNPAPRTGSDANVDTDFWSLARSIRSDLLLQNNFETALHSADMLAGHVPQTPLATAAVIAEEAGADLMLTNLGIVELAGGPTRVVGLTAPAMWVRMKGYAVISVATFDGQLTMTLTTDDRSMLLLDDLTSTLQRVCTPPNAS